jgi:hypothetical protein
MRLKYVLSTLLLASSLMTAAHPLHLTFTNLEFKPGQNRWELTIKVFSDDFASDVNLATGEAGVPEARSQRSEADRILKAWLRNRFTIGFDSNIVEVDSWVLRDIRVKEDASWITFSFTAPMPTREIRIRNALLLDLYGDQKNLFVVTMGQYQAAHEFKNKSAETAFKLNK